MCFKASFRQWVMCNANLGIKSELLCSTHKKDCTSALFEEMVTCFRASTLAGSCLIPSADTMSPQKGISFLAKRHLSSFNVKPDSSKIRTTCSKIRSCWSFDLLAMMMSSCMHCTSGIPYQAKDCRAKVTNFWLGDENFARRIVSPDEKIRPSRFFAQKLALC